jgi:predicted nuclease of predicted toxin-antitoxin system
MKILIDMNLSPEWVEVFLKEGWKAVHWSSAGQPNDPDTVIMQWAKTNGYIVFTHDLDFGAILAATKADAPSVFQIRIQDVMPLAIGKRVITAFQKFQPELEAGALVTVNEATGKVRILPI